MEGKRRQFLKNITALGASLTVAPTILKSAEKLTFKGGQNCDPTTLDYYGQGPFYTANAPDIQNNQLASSVESGVKLIISGQVKTLDCLGVIQNAEIDIWQANDNGDYDNAGYNLRGKTYSNSQGFYVFETIKPGFYLNGPTYRPSHIHIKVTPPNYPTLTTQLYFEGDPYISSDAAASINSGTYDATNRIIPLTDNNGVLEGTWDIIVDGINDIDSLNKEKGIVYQVHPNPFSEKIIINYGVFQEANVYVSVYSLKGDLVAHLNEKQLKADKYEAEWTPCASVPNGHYFIVLKINDLQVAAQRVVLNR